jgi:hypothetical protein
MNKFFVSINILCGILVGTMIPFLSTAQTTYWQQRVNYEMNIDFEVKKHQFTGKQKLTYFNNSSDTLEKVFYHLYFNAFQPNSMMDVRSRTIADPDARVGNRISTLKPHEIGYHKIKSLKQDGQVLEYEVVETILEVKLKKPILPNTQTVFEMEFESQVPIQIRRSGRDNAEGIAYSMTQWYPKMCEYDREGWHANPYIGREFHGIWGDFEVKITIDSSYVLGGTGYLQNPTEIGHGYEEKGQSLKRPASSKLTWHFKAPNVHDFAWAADPDYTHTVFKTKQGLTLHFLYQKNDKTTYWAELPEYTAKAFDLMNQTFGQYPYQQYTVIQGGDGGMEYPMTTLISGERNLGSLVIVTVHELIHSWFQGVLATDESLYAWMDEGFTSYCQVLMTVKLGFDDSPNPFADSYESYFALMKNGYPEPLTTHADHYLTNQTYGINAYSKGAIFLHQLSYIVGQETFEKGMLAYFNTWKFKHPTYTDFKRVMEKVSGLELDWYFEYWIHTVHTIDYKIETVKKVGKGTEITLQKLGVMPMPIDLVITLKNGEKVTHYIPLGIMRGEKTEKNVKMMVEKDWFWTHPKYTLTIEHNFQDIEQIEIDPSYKMADIEHSNNIYSTNPK